MKKVSTSLLLAVCLTLSAAHAATTEGRKDLMPLGSPAPAFALTDVVSGKTVTLADFSEKKALVVMFICRHCPYVQHVKSALARLAADYADEGVGFVAISSNDPAAYPADAPESLAEMAREEGFAFPLLFDEAQSAARAYTAVATPDTFIFDGERKLVYRGQLDDTRPDGAPATAADVRAALDALLAGRPIPSPQKPSIGCGIKWRQ